MDTIFKKIEADHKNRIFEIFSSYTTQNPNILEALFEFDSTEAVHLLMDRHKRRIFVRDYATDVSFIICDLSVSEML